LSSPIKSTRSSGRTDELMKKFAQPDFMIQKIRDFIINKKWPQIWLASAIFKKSAQRKQSPNKTKNSPNLVTLVLISSDNCFQRKFFQLVRGGVARWFIFKPPKKTILVNFGVP
jgi:hypothetical protein